MSKLLLNTLVTIGLTAIACLVCLLLRIISGNPSFNGYTPMIFVLAVFLVARFTNGYAYGIIASLAGVLAVNYFFSFPYLAFNFTLPGYPIEISTMLIVSIMTSALTSRAKKLQEIQIENEREKTRANLLRAVSHDLRTPLTAISGAVSTVDENEATLSSAEKHKLLRGALEDAQWMTHMVENILAVTRIDEGRRAKITKTPEAVEEVIGETVAKFRSRYPDPEVSVSVPEEPLFVPMDAVLIEVVLNNILENAVIHGEKVTHIRLDVKRVRTDAVFEVRDNGIGVKDNIIKKIREGSYIDSENAETDGRKNMGIGLTVCGSIIKAHGGIFEVENNPEGGAAFRFLLPCEDADKTNSQKGEDYDDERQGIGADH